MIHIGRRFRLASLFACLAFPVGAVVAEESMADPSRGSAGAEDSPEEPGPWIQLFNGRNLDGWIVKINHHPLGDNFGDTFRVSEGILQVRYDNYDQFDDQFGHLYYHKPFSNYHLAVEYRFVGELQPGAPDFAVLNSGVIFHAQDPKTILLNQNWPIGVELQFLAGLGDGRPRATGNSCTPGTHVHRDGRLVEDHVIGSSAQTYRPDEWVRAEVIVSGNGDITHVINGQEVLAYSQPVIGGGVVEGYDPAVFVEGKPINAGYIGLQSEGQPVDFRKVELKMLEPNPSERGE